MTWVEYNARTRALNVDRITSSKSTWGYLIKRSSAGEPSLAVAQGVTPFGVQFDILFPTRYNLILAGSPPLRGSAIRTFALDYSLGRCNFDSRLRRLYRSSLKQETRSPDYLLVTVDAFQATALQIND